MEALCRLSYSGGVGDDSKVLVRILPVAMVVLITACGPTTVDGFVAGDVTFTTDDGEVQLNQIPLADTQEERARGLMGVTQLGRDEGMLFSFEEASETEFWMKNTLIPLDIAFWGSDGVVSSIVSMEPCPEEPCRMYGASAPFLYALEMRTGWFARNGVEVGDRAEAELFALG